MQASSILPGLLVLAGMGAPVWLVVRYCRRRPAAVNIPLRGIGGWLALFAFCFCLGFLRSIAELALGMPDYLAGFENVAARGPLAIVGLTALTTMAVYLWAIVAFFQAKREFRIAYGALWGLSLLTPFAMLPALSVPGVTLDMLFTEMEVVKSIAALIFMGVWYWYFTVSERAKNTFVN